MTSSKMVAGTGSSACARSLIYADKFALHAPDKLASKSASHRTTKTTEAVVVDVCLFSQSVPDAWCVETGPDVGRRSDLAAARNRISCPPVLIAHGAN